MNEQVRERCKMESVGNQQRKFHRGKVLGELQIYLGLGQSEQDVTYHVEVPGSLV